MKNRFLLMVIYIENKHEPIMNEAGEKNKNIKFQIIKIKFSSFTINEGCLQNAKVLRKTVWILLLQLNAFICRKDGIYVS
jgi:hypothetical protein